MSKRVLQKALWLALLAPLALLHAISPGIQSTVVQDQAAVPIETPAFAQRRVVKLKLSNELEAYLVSDPAAEKSAAGLCVQTGSWDDPADLPGMAHFVEHMLFLGTVKYPEESAFDRFVGQHDGETNAQTGELDTCYFFSIDTSAFVEGLDRFASFFKEPLFNPSGVAREIHAIEQEFALRSRMDVMRQWLVYKELAHVGHPFHRFEMGNQSTLNAVPRDRLLSWYHQHYSANLMHLLLYSSLPLEELESLAVSQFSEIPNPKRLASRWDSPMTDAQMQGTISWIEPIQDERSLTLFWEMPGEFADTKAYRPEDLVAYVLGHEGSRSLLAELKRERLAEGLFCGGQRMGVDRAIFMLHIDLTKAGLDHYETVVERCFQAIEMLRRKGVPRAIFDDFQRIEKLNYQYQMREKAFTFVEKYTPLLLEEPLATFPEQSTIIQKYDAGLIQKFIAALTPQKAHVSIAAPSRELPVVLDRQEHWTGVVYRVETVPAEKLTQWSRVTPHPDIDLPLNNPFIPRHLTAELPTPPAKPFTLPVPKVVIDDTFGKVYFASDHLYGVPTISWSLQILTPEVDSGDALKTVMADLYVKSLMESLADSLYEAQIAGLQCEIQRDHFGLVITVQGYRENALLLFRQIAERLRAVRPDQVLFRIYKDSQRLDYVNASLDPPFTQACNALKTLLYKQEVPNSEKAKVIRGIDHKDFLEYAAKLFRRNYSQMMLYGSMNETEVAAVWQALRQNLGGDPYSSDSHPRLEVAELGSMGSPAVVEIKAKTKGNALLLTIETSPFSFENDAIQQLLMQALKAPFYAALRTEQQTSYYLSTWEEESEGHLFSFFGASSNSHTGKDLLSRFELFIESFLQELGTEELSKESFDRLRQVLATNLEQPPESLSEMGKLLNELAFDHQADFEWKSKQAQALHQLKFSDFLTGSQALLGKTNPRRLAILIKGEQPESGILEYQTIKNPKALREKILYAPR